MNLYSFGMLMPNRTFTTNHSYKYGFNGKENDNEVKGEGSQQDYGFRIYDPRIGKFLSVDPLTQSYPWYTPYQFAGNKPIWAIDVDGLEEYYSNITGEWLGRGKKDPKNSEARLATKFEPVKNEKGEIVPNEYVIYESKKITFQNPGAELSKLYKDAQNAGGKMGKEKGGFFVLNTENATVSFRRHKQYENENKTNQTRNDDILTVNGVSYVSGEKDLVIVLAQVHTHQNEHTYLGKSVESKGGKIKITDQYIFDNQYSTPTGDGNDVMNDTYNIFTIGINVDFFSNKGRQKSINGITTRAKIFNNTYNILKTALEKHGGKY